MGTGSGVGAMAGFAQLGLGITLLIILTTHLRHAGPGSCVFGAADEDGILVCDWAQWLAYLSVGSSLIISVGQGALSLLVGVPARSVEVLSRLALALGWVALAVLTTIATINSDKADPNADRTHWRHVGLGLTAALTFLALVMALTAGAGACCGDCPLATLLCCLLPCCCCCRDCLHGLGHGHGGHQIDCCQLTGLACCLYWCFPRSWLRGSGTTTTTTVYTYAPVPPGPAYAGGNGGAGAPPNPPLAICPPKPLGPPPPPANYQPSPGPKPQLAICTIPGVGSCPHHLPPKGGPAGPSSAPPPSAGASPDEPHPTVCWIPRVNTCSEHVPQQPQPAYTPPPILGPAQTPNYYPSMGSTVVQQTPPPPLIAHVYSPFTQGPAPPTLGWGVPMLPPPPAAPPAFYPPVMPSEPGEARPSAPLPQLCKEGYEPPSAPPAPR